MKRYKVAIIFSLLISLLTASCGGKKAAAVQDEASADAAVAADSTAEESLEAEVADLPMPRAADELFDDFIFNFAANKKLQLERIVFPLKKTNGNREETIGRDQWQIERYFMRQDYYTLIFDNAQQMEVVKDTSVNHAVVEMIYFNTGAVIQHVFDRMRGAWMLTAVHTIPIAQSDNSSFLTFYQQFARDEDFQQQSLNETIQFEGPDPDDDFSQMEGVITPDTWEAFAPELPERMIFNIVYGKSKPSGNTKIFVIRGIANGMELELTFKRIGGQWKLVKLTT